jgi:hypothetical protein
MVSSIYDLIPLASTFLPSSLSCSCQETIYGLMHKAIYVRYMFTAGKRIDVSVSIVTRLRAGRPGFDSWQGQE